MVCSEKALPQRDTKTILHIQYALLVLFLLTVTLLNAVAIYITVKLFKKCLISRLFGSSYLGNIMAACSLFGGDMGSLFSWGILFDCTKAADRHFFLYLGISVNMTVLSMNTYLRTSNIKSVSRNTTCNRSLWAIKMPLVVWVSSIVWALGGVYLEISLQINFTEVTLGVLTPFFIGVIVLNIQLSIFLHKQKKRAASLSEQPTSSYANIHSAENVVRRVVWFQVCSYLTWIVVVSLIKNLESEQSFYAISVWMSRGSFLLSFCCECITLVTTRWIKCRKCLVSCFTEKKSKRRRDHSSFDTTSNATGNLELTELATVENTTQ